MIENVCLTVTLRFDTFYFSPGNLFGVTSYAKKVLLNRNFYINSPLLRLRLTLRLRHDRLKNSTNAKQDVFYGKLALSLYQSNIFISYRHWLRPLWALMHYYISPTLFLVVIFFFSFLSSCFALAFIIVFMR